MTARVRNCFGEGPGGEFVSVALMLGMSAWALIFGPFFLLWWLPGHLELKRIKCVSKFRSERRTEQSKCPDRTPKSGDAK